MPMVKENENMTKVLDVDMATVETKIESLESRARQLEKINDTPLAN